MPERYVHGRLGAIDVAAFEEHSLGCNECFQQVQLLERPIPILEDADDDAVWGGNLIPTWIRLCLAAAIAAILLLAGAIAWLALDVKPRLEREVAAQKARADLAQLKLEVQEGRTLEALASAEPNFAVVTLGESGKIETVTLAPGASHIGLWIVAPAGVEPFRVEVSDVAARSVVTVRGLHRNASGFLTTAIASRVLRPGIFRVRVFAAEATAALSDYQFAVK